VRNLPDFPGIQIADEPPVELFEKMLNRSKWLPGTELLGCYSGVSRAENQYNLVRTSPGLIFVFRGPIRRCSTGNLPDEVKQVVMGTPVKVNADSSGKPNGVPLKANSRRSEATLAR
jgi:predicted Zn-dependent protease with MMP-like domain